MYKSWYVCKKFFLTRKLTGMNCMTGSSCSPICQQRHTILKRSEEEEDGEKGDVLLLESISFSLKLSSSNPSIPVRLNPTSPLHSNPFQSGENQHCNICSSPTKCTCHLKPHRHSFLMLPTLWTTGLSACLALCPALYDIAGSSSKAMNPVQPSTSCNHCISLTH
jgi:hypothetical protein